MPFHVSARTLERLDWPQLCARLADHARTPGGRARCAPGAEGSPAAAGEAPFAGNADEARQRLAETAEAHAVLRASGPAPLAGLEPMEGLLHRLGRGGILGARELGQLASALGTLHAVRHYLLQRAEAAPRLAGLAADIVEHRDLETEIAFSFDAEGEIRDEASPVLAEARAAVRQLGSELQRRLAALLHAPEVAPHLSDTFVTTRNDRFVLPVRADARGHVRGIVHDASGSGATVFVEPEAAVGLNNRLKGAELEVQRETLRILRTLSSQAAEAAPDVLRGLGALERIDLAFARAELALELGAVEPEVGEEGVYRLPQLRHPLLAGDTVVPNDVALGEGVQALVLSGPNAGGKTVLMKAVALAGLSVRAGLFVTAAPGARVDLAETVLADIGDEQDLRESQSTFSAHVENLARILEAASPRALVVLDEIGQGTDPGEGAALAQAVLEALADRGARVVATTHFNLLKELADVDDRFANASFEFDPETHAPSYRLRAGKAGVSSALAVAARMGIPGAVLERADALLSGEDRRLDQLLGELAASRAALEQERHDAERLRAESEAARDDYRQRLERLQARRDQAYQRMRADLERAFRDAHAQVAAVIRDLQRGGGARDAARARERLQALAQQSDEVAREVGVADPAGAGSPEPPVDWDAARPGDPVRLRGGGEAALVSLPDARGRVTVQAGAARLELPAERLAAARPGARGEARPRPSGPRDASRPAPGEGGATGADRHGPDAATAPDAEAAAPLHPVGRRCDLRGLRVASALDALARALDGAAAEGESCLVVVHGLGTGALRDAVRRELGASPYVSRFGPARAEDGGDGVTLVRLG